MTASKSRESRLPRTVLVVNDANYLDIASDPKEVALLAQRDAMIVPYGANPEFFSEQVHRVRELLDEAGQLTPGTLLIKSPYDTTTYSHADAAIEEFTNTKYNAIGRIAGLLGATRVEFIDATVERTNRTWTAALSAPIKMMRGEAKFKREVEQRVRRRMAGTMTFAGGSADISGARAYMEHKQLSFDTQLNDLVELRSGRSVVESYEMTFSGVKEADANFSAALDLAGAGPIKDLKIGASFVQTVSSASEIEIEMRITFPSAAPTADTPPNEAAAG
jgi:hypothetical protein